MLRTICALVMGLVPLSLAAQVRIHDPVVRVLAKPYGIERRIQLVAFEDADFGPEGSGRLTVSLRNSGVKRVTLEQPVFRLEVAGADGRWEDLGELRIGEIVFPMTGEERSVTRRHVVDFRPRSGGAEAIKRLRAAAAAGRAFRFKGHAGMRVKLGEARDFHREKLGLELGGTVSLGKGFSPRWHRSEKSLPEVGRRS
jgi:hypothetical protein